MSRGVQLDPLEERGTILAPPFILLPFRGHWSATLETCGAPPDGPSNLWIAARSFKISGTHGRIVRVVSENTEHAVVTLRSDGEGGTLEAKKRLTLLAKGQVLAVRNQDDTAQARFHRCADQTAGPGFIPHHILKR